MIQSGTPAPSDITLQDQHGNDVSLADYKGKKLVVFFYPKANTPTCTKEACNLRDNVEELRQAGYEIVGVSPDTVRRQSNFAEKFDLPYPLLADTDNELAKAFGAWGEKKMYGKTYEGILRSTFIVDESGIVTGVIDKVKATEHSQQILAAAE